jgi:hypothetical protein
MWRLASPNVSLAMLCAPALECGLKAFYLGMETTLILKSEVSGEHFQALGGSTKEWVAYCDTGLGESAI